MNPPSSPALPERPAWARPSPWRSLDRAFTAILAGSFLAHVGAVAALAARPSLPVPGEDREPPIVRGLVLPLPLSKPPAGAGAHPEPGKPRPAPRGPSSIRPGPAPGAADVHDAVTDSLRWIGTTNQDALGLVLDGLRNDGSMRPVSEALDGARRAGPAAGPSDPGRRDTAPQTAVIGDPTTTGGGDVGLDPVRPGPRGPRPGLVVEPPTLPRSCDREAIAARVKSFLGAVRLCYESELARHRGLRGRVVMRFTIGTTGQVTEAAVDDESLGSAAVAACIERRVERWRFDPPAGECPVEFPVVFESGG